MRSSVRAWRSTCETVHFFNLASASLLLVHALLVAAGNRAHSQLFFFLLSSSPIFFIFPPLFFEFTRQFLCFGAEKKNQVLLSLCWFLWSVSSVKLGNFVLILEGRVSFKLNVHRFSVLHLLMVETPVINEFGKENNVMKMRC